LGYDCESICTFWAKVIVAGVAVPDTVVVDSLALGAAVAGVAVAVVLGLHLLPRAWPTFS
jgi:hypothetical protein